MDSAVEQKQETKPTTTPVQKKEGGGGGSSGSGGLKSQLRGMGYDEGAALLSPVQKKGDKGPKPLDGEKGHGGDGTKTDAKTETKGDTKGKDQEAAVKLGKFSNLRELFSAAGDTAHKLFVSGAALKLSVEGQIAFWHVLGALAKIDIQVAENGGKIETEAKFHMGAGLLMTAGVKEIAEAEIKGMICGDYALKATGDSVGECVRLMMLGIKATMNSVGSGHSATADKEQAKKEPWYRKAWNLLKSAAALPGKAWQWSINKIVGMAWGQNTSLEENLNEAEEQMDDKDQVEVTRGIGMEAGLGLNVGGVGGKVEGEQYHNAQKLKLNKEAIKRDGEGKILPIESEKGQRTKLAIELGVEHVCKVKAEIDEFTSKDSSEAELVVEMEGNVVHFAKRGSALILGALGKFKTDASKSFTGGDAKKSVDDAIHKATEGHKEAHGGGGDHGGGDHHGPAVEAGVELKWKYDGKKWSLQAVELMTKVKLEAPMEGGIVSGKLGASATYKKAVYHNHGDHKEGHDDKEHKSGH